MNVEKLQSILTHLNLEEGLIKEMLTTGHSRQLMAGAPLISPGTTGSHMPLVISGTLRIMREDEEGKELFLYYLEGGEACAMSISCCMSEHTLGFKALAETNVSLWMVPLNLLNEWMGKYSSFRKFIIDSYQARFDELMHTIDSIAFMNMDERLLKYLLDKKQSSGSYVIDKTHEQIATELNTSRVVISRLLKKLEREEKVELYRNRIEVL